MKLKCTVEQVLPMQSGTRANGTPWKSQQVVLSWMESERENQFTHRVVVTMMNETVDTFAARNCYVGSVVECNLMLYARFSSYNGKPYNEAMVEII